MIPEEQNSHYLPDCSHLCWLVVVIVAQAAGTWEEESSFEELPPSDWPVAPSVGRWLS